MTAPSLRIGDQRMMAALHTYGAVQPSGASEERRLKRLAGKRLAEQIPGTTSYRLTTEGRAWVLRSQGHDSPPVAEDPIVADRKRLDRGLGFADDEAA